MGPGQRLWEWPAWRPAHSPSVFDYGLLNVAQRVLAEFILIVQVPVPVQVTPHPLNVLGGVGAAVSVTDAPFATLAVQPVAVHESQVTPDTVPFPVPW